MEIYDELLKVLINSKPYCMKYTKELDEIISLSQNIKREIFLYMENWKKQYLLDMFHELINCKKENLIIPENFILEFVSLIKELKSSVEELSLLVDKGLSEPEKENIEVLEDKTETSEESSTSFEAKEDCLDDEEELIKAIKKSLEDFDAREVKKNYDVFDEKNSLNEIVLKNEEFISVEMPNESKFCSENKELLESARKLEYPKFDFSNDAMIDEIKKSLEDYSSEKNSMKMKSKDDIENKIIRDFEKNLITPEKKLENSINFPEKSSKKIAKKKIALRNTEGGNHGEVDKENIMPHHVDALPKSLGHSPVEDFRVDASHEIKSILKSRQRSISSSSIYNFFQFEHHADHFGYKSTPRFSENCCEPSSIIQNIKDKVTFKLTPDYKIISDDSGSLKMSDSHHSTFNHSIQPFNISKTIFNYNSPFGHVNVSLSKDDMFTKNRSLRRSSSLGINPEVSHKELLSKTPGLNSRFGFKQNFINKLNRNLE